MSFTDKVTELGNHVKFTPNTKGTERRGVPSAIAEMSRTQTAGAVADPTRLTTVGSKVRGLNKLGPRKKIGTKV